MPEFISILKWIRDVVYPKILELKEIIYNLPDQVTGGYSQIYIDDLKNELLEEIEIVNNKSEIETIEDLLSYNGIGTVFVKDTNRGGNFVSKTAIERDPNTGSLYLANGGTVFAKLGGGFWVRQFSGAVNVKWFGAKGDNTDTYTALQSAIDFVEAIQGELYFPNGTYAFSSKLSIGKNIILKGNGKNFGSCLNPTGTAYISIDGTDEIGGWAFRSSIRDILVYGNNSTAANLININKAYEIDIDIYLHNNINKNGIRISGSNNIVINNPMLFNSNNENSNGIYITTSSVAINNPDIENWLCGILVSTNAEVTINSPYSERNISGIKTSGAKFCTINGGKYSIPNSSCNGIVLQSNASIVGGSYDLSNGGSSIVVDSGYVLNNTHILGVPYSSIHDIKKQAKIYSNTVDGFKEMFEIKKTTLSDNIATTVHSINIPFVSTGVGFLDVELNARDNSGYSIWIANYRLGFTNPDGTVRVTSVIEYAKSNVNISANYGLAITCSATTASSTVNFNVTANTSGTLGEGTSCIVQTKAKLIAREEDTLNVYFK